MTALARIALTRIAALCAALAASPLAAQESAQEAAPEAVRLFGPESASREITLRTTTDIAILEPTVAAYLDTRPDLALRYEQWGSNDLFALTAAECASGRPTADMVISSGVHQMVKLVNDKCAAPWTSPETLALPADLRWRDEVWGVSREPAVMVYNRDLVPPGERPATRFDGNAVTDSVPFDVESLRATSAGVAITRPLRVMSTIHGAKHSANDAIWTMSHHIPVNACSSDEANTPTVMVLPRRIGNTVLGSPKAITCHSRYKTAMAARWFLPARRPHGHTDVRNHLRPKLATWSIRSNMSGQIPCSPL